MSQPNVNALVAASHADPKLEGPVYVQIALQKPAVSHRQDHALLATLPNKFRRKDELMSCLVVKDPSHPISSKLLDTPTTSTLFDEVIGVGKLRRRIAHGKKNAKTTKQAEQFAQTFSQIFVQDRVAEPLKEALGIGFYKRSRNLPIPIKIELDSLNKEDYQRQLKAVVRAASQSAQIILKPDSKLSSVRVGHTKMDAKKLAANVDALVKFAKAHIPDGLGASATFYIKTADSSALKLDT